MRFVPSGGSPCPGPTADQSCLPRAACGRPRFGSDRAGTRHLGALTTSSVGEYQKSVAMMAVEKALRATSAIRAWSSEMLPISSRAQSCRLTKRMPGGTGAPGCHPGVVRTMSGSLRRRAESSDRQLVEGVVLVEPAGQEEGSIAVAGRSHAQPPKRSGMVSVRGARPADS